MSESETVERRSQTGAPNGHPGGVPTKFDADGSVRHFPGNTIICHLPAESDLHKGLLRLSQELETANPETLYTLLPTPSWHMTVFEGVCDQVRRPGFWPSDLPGDTSLDECNAHFEKKLRQFGLGTEPPFKLRIAGYTPRIDGIGLHLEPVDAIEQSRLRALRDRLSETLCIRHPSHETYGFHLSIAYFIRHPTDIEREQLDARLMRHLAEFPSVFELGAPEFCHFDDMFAFRRQFYLE